MAKRELQKLIADLKAKQYRDGEAKGLLSAIQKEQTEALKPVLNDMAIAIGQAAKNAVEEAIKDIKVDVPDITIPPINVEVPDVVVPEIKAPQVRVNIPEVKVPEVKIPETKFPDRMSVFMEGVDNKRPLAVQMFGVDGKPLVFPMATGGKGDYLTIKGIQNSAWGDLLNSDGRLKVETNDTGSSGTTTVQQLSGAVDSVNVVDAFGSTTVDGVWNADNRLRVSVETGGSGLTDAELRATHLDVLQVSGAVESVNVQQIAGNDAVVGTGYSDNALRVTHATDQIQSINVADAFGSTSVGSLFNSDNRLRVSTEASASSIVTDVEDGAGDSIMDAANNAMQVNLVAQSLASTAVNVVDSTGVAYSGSNPVPVTGTVTATPSGTQDTNVTQVGGNSVVVGTGYQDNALRVVNATDAITSVNLTQTLGNNTVVGTGYSDNALRVVHATDVVSSVSLATALASEIDSITTVQLSGAIDSTQTHLIARTTNPSATSDGNAVFATADDLGRTLVRPHQVRDLVKTAYVALTDSSEDTLLSGTASTFNDLLYVMGANESDAAVNVDFRTGTGGAVVATLAIPANSTNGIVFPVPMKQSEVAQAWTAQNNGSDISNTTISITAGFSAEV